MHRHLRSTGLSELASDTLSETLPVLDGTYTEEPEIERLMEMRTLIDRLNIRVNLLGHHISNTVPITGALPDDKTAILREFDKAIAEFPEEELKSYRSRIWHL
ncbi:hypothetical protein [Sangeribacter muris]|uniref:hypothetical protein n=1 Tax=Sangeribacter muris TaxID=2880703 RepID=UPI00244DF96A|nr:hypothetical protein [Sangeribacter muris]